MITLKADKVRSFNGGMQEVSSLVFADLLRIDIGRKLDAARQVELGQFFTGAPVAEFMAGMFEAQGSSLHLLDAGAGVGSLTAAFVAEMCSREQRPQLLTVTAYEADEALLPHLKETLEACRVECERAGIAFKSQAHHADFIEAGVEQLNGGPFATGEAFDCAILNPPYRKIGRDSSWRRALSLIGIETSNLYTAFLWLSMRLLKPGGELVAITPRSFCNGPYFKPFRVALAEEMTLRRFHLFESRQEAFKDNDVLQENIVFHAVKGHGRKNGAAPPVSISSSSGPLDEAATLRKVPASQVVRPGDKDVFINIVPDEWGRRVAEQMSALSASLSELKIAVSTGRVVDFRATDYLRAEPDERPGESIAPLIYPLHFAEGFIEWPQTGGKKAKALAVTPETASLLNEAGFYVLVKRFSSKEQKRRIMAAIYDPERVSWGNAKAPQVAFENHLNYFHEGGSGLSQELATGLSAYLNSTLVDAYFRQFNGHTQVNATDLRSLKYPSRPVLEELGRRILDSHGDKFPAQNELDLLTEELFSMPGDEDLINPTQAKRRLEEALLILKALKVDRQQQNERSALTLLALLDLAPGKEWAEAGDPLRGIRSILDFCREVYGKAIAENTRETYRRQTIHQFMQAGIVSLNPDNPKRPVNSPHNVYQVTPEILSLVRTFGAPGWEKSLETFAASQKAIQGRALQERALHRIPVTTPAGETFTLSPGGQNVLIKEILEQFCPRFSPGGKVLYLGDADEKWAFYDAGYLAGLGVVVDEHGKMPDVVVHHIKENWLLLIEAVTSHGPVDPKRHIELKELFSGSSAGLVFVTTFLDRAAMGKYLRDIAWETEVWVADAPDHLIHFNGERFLGPYPSKEPGESAPADNP